MKIDDIYQKVIGGIFIAWGILGMSFPTYFTEKFFTPSFVGVMGATSALILVMRYLGSVCTVCGVIILSSKFTVTTYRNLALAMLPYFIVDYYFWSTGVLTTLAVGGDCTFGAICIACCAAGYKTVAGVPKEPKKDK